MDTSKKYIEMCHEAKEIQDRWIPKICDIVGGFDSNKTTTISKIAPLGSLSFPDGGSVNLPSTVVWLPRLDQLLGLITYLSWVEFDKRCKIAARDAYIRGGMSWRDPCDITKEQAGLMVVMTENTRKRWNDSIHEWVDDRIKRD